MNTTEFIKESRLVATKWRVTRDTLQQLVQDDLSKTGVCQDPSVNDWDVLLDGTFTAEWTSCSHPEESGTHKLNVMRVEWEVAKLADARGLIPFEKGHVHEQ